MAEMSNLCYIYFTIVDQSAHYYTFSLSAEKKSGIQW